MKKLRLTILTILVIIPCLSPRASKVEEVLNRLKNR